MEELISTRDWDYLINDVIRRENVLIGQASKDKKTILSLPLDGIKPSISSGLYSGQNILSFFGIVTKDYNQNMNFDSLLIPFKCIGTNIETGEEKIFEKGILADALRASMSIPSVFQPYEIDNELYVDGGLVNNFPTDVVKEMGADIIIGVDVGAVLYKKEEITSIIQILDQSSSFYNARISKKNKRLCHVYMRPDISGISAMDFSQTAEIIERGTKSALSQMSVIDSVIRENPGIVDSSLIKRYNIPKDSSLSLNPAIDSIRIMSFTTSSYNSSNRKSINRLVKGKMNLKTPLTISNTELEAKINRVYGSQYFETVKLRYTKLDSAYKINIQVTEKTDNNFSIGARFDKSDGVNLLLRAEFRNLFIYGSLLETSIVAGQSPQVKIRYTTDRGSYFGVGSSINYNYFEAHTYEGDKILSSFNFNYVNTDIFLHSNIGNYNRFILGAETSVFDLSSFQAVSKLKDIDQAYYGVFLAYVIDTWDDAYYPNEGVKAKFKADLIGAENNTVYTHAWWRFSHVFSLHDKVKLITEGFVGVASIGVDTTFLRYAIGGMEKNRIQWYNSFPGLRFLQDGSNNVWILKFSPRYEFINNNYLTYTFAFAGLDNHTLHTFTEPERFYTGMSLKYGFKSMFGPLEVSLDYSLQSYQKHIFVSLGFWF